uniref:Uncharacterized protein n=1 Tax=Anguilla anguilla TaxID=7936 RepID=A0A0E9UTG9_ANGAN
MNIMRLRFSICPKTMTNK